MNDHSHIHCVLSSIYIFGKDRSGPLVVILLFVFILCIYYLTSNPSARRHSLCASINFIQSTCSSPLNTTHSSRAFFVSGQQQQIFFPDLIPTFCYNQNFNRKTRK